MLKTPPPIELLLVDDNDTDLFIYKKFLNRFNDIQDIYTAHNVTDALHTLSDRHIDCLLVDYKLCGETGLDLLKQLDKKDHPHLAKIMVTGEGNERLAAKMFDYNIQNYLLKKEINADLLHEAILEAIEKQHLATKLEYLAFHDLLTKTYNRAYFMEHAQKAIERAFRLDQDMALLYLDLNDFKEINDTHGHDLGDKVLIAFAKRLKKAIRKMDMLARLGGDEFVIMIENTPSFKAHYIVQKILKNFETPLMIDGKPYHIQTSIGFSVLPQTAHDLETLLCQSDMALYEAKKNGHLSYVKFKPALNG